MDGALIVSPHLDDAVLSCGQLLVGWPNCIVLTVMAGVPPAGTPATTFDQNCGFTSAVRAVQTRRNEDGHALSLLRATPVHLDFLDGQYESADELAVCEQIRGAIIATKPNKVVIPLGLAHPDHLLVAEAAFEAARAAGAACWAYEELPARVLWPEEVCERLGTLWGRGLEPKLDFIGEGLLARKQAAITAYRSQLWALDMRCCLVPERYWRLL